STGGTNLNLSGASASELTNAKNYIATSSTATGSETTLSRDTWGVGKTASAFSGLPSYTADAGTLTPFYTGTISASYDFYYGVNVSTAKTPGTYTGEVLYTVLMDSACTSYTLNFNGNSATTNTLTSQDLAFDSALDLAAISDSTKIARTGYTLTGWKDQNNNSYGITGTVDINPDDLSSVTLTAQWTANTYTITYNGNGSTSGSTTSQTSQAYTSNVTLQANGFTKTGYNFLGWSLDSSATTASYSASTAYAVSTIVNAANQANNNGATITLYAVWRQSVTYMQDWGYADCAKLNTNEYLTLRDSRDDNDYVVKKLADGKCWMVENLRLVGSRTLTSSDSNVSSDFALTASTAPTWCTTNSSDCDDRSLVYYVSSEASDSSKSSYYGALYNWYAATAGTGKYATSSGNASSSICPKGWRLPTGGSSGEFAALDKAWGGTGANRSGANTYSTFTGAYTSSNNGGFGLAGYIYGSLFRVGSYGFYWASAAYSSNYAYGMGLDSSTALL
ncbi:InlB B-repeat-containing protein, partial [Candidatus Saccharibacteria bacterium]|nr:InlB B-repeat-containing protein [Candidatus Saccharibacteria bacterium]